MPLTEEAAIAQAQEILRFRLAEKERLETIHDYLRGKQAHPATPQGMPTEVTRLAQLSRVNIMEIVVGSVAQAMYVDGYLAPREAEDAPAWEVWQANKMDAWQTGVHRAALSYGVSYVTVLPGDSMPAIRGYSPRRMTALYGIDDEWPEVALSATPNRGKWLYRLYDREGVYIIEGPEEMSSAPPRPRGRNVRQSSSTVPGATTDLQFKEFQAYGVTLEVVPVVRFLNTRDLDEDRIGEVEPLMELQDQIDLTTFELLVAQHYAAFRQRYILGWVAQTEAELLSASAARIMTFEDSPEDVKVGEFEQTDLKGYLESRESSLRHAATLSQTPVHELTGALVNLSAEALVAAEVGQRRKITERTMSMGESWEQTLDLAGRLAGFEASEMAQVRWRDTESRALTATVDALGKMAQMLGIPPQELWERVPNVSQQDVERWKAALEEGGALGQLTSLLDRQAAEPGEDAA